MKENTEQNPAVTDRRKNQEQSECRYDEAKTGAFWDSNQTLYDHQHTVSLQIRRQENDLEWIQPFWKQGKQPASVTKSYLSTTQLYLLRGSCGFSLPGKTERKKTRKKTEK